MQNMLKDFLEVCIECSKRWVVQQRCSIKHSKHRKNLSKAYTEYNERLTWLIEIYAKYIKDLQEV